MLHCFTLIKVPIKVSGGSLGVYRSQERWGGDSYSSLTPQISLIRACTERGDPYTLCGTKISTDALRFGEQGQPLSAAVSRR